MLMGDNSAAGSLTFTVPAADYNEFLRFKAVHQPSSSTVVAQFGNSVAFVSTSSSIGHWVLDSGASDHMT
ncbi:hypothetical protein A2U01_0088181, partial [Trifolium medium]|nr:hypothetical protein [Trifolium medium]